MWSVWARSQVIWPRSIYSTTRCAAVTKGPAPGVWEFSQGFGNGFLVAGEQGRSRGKLRWLRVARAPESLRATGPRPSRLEQNGTSCARGKMGPQNRPLSFGHPQWEPVVVVVVGGGLGLAHSVIWGSALSHRASVSPLHSLLTGAPLSFESPWLKMTTTGGSHRPYSGLQKKRRQGCLLHGSPTPHAPTPPLSSCCCS